MAIPSVTADILPGIAGLLGDPAQEQFTAAVCLPYYSTAFREAFNLAMAWGLPAIRRDAYTMLAANTTVLTPAQAGIVDMGEPIAVWERGGISTLTITGVTNATPMVVTTSAAHNLGEGAPVEIYGVVGPVGINQRWRIHYLSATTFSLNGSTAGGAYTSGGTVIVGGEESSNPFALVAPADDLANSSVGSTLGSWRWSNDVFQFVGASAAVELWIQYESSGAAPQTGSVGWDNCQDFLMYRAASLIGPAYDMVASATYWKMEALGPSGRADGTGGMLRSFMYPMLREKQKRGYRPGPFRSRNVAYARNT